MSRRKKSMALGAGLLLGCGLLYLGGNALLEHWSPKPPVSAPRVGEEALVPGEKNRVGPCWFGERGGLPVLYLKGSPLQMGRAQGLLTATYFHRMEADLLNAFQTYVPHEWMRKIIRAFVTFRMRGLSDCMPPPIREEVQGMSLGCPDLHPEEGPFYSRLLQFQAVLDISTLVMNHPLLSGCTAFAAWGGRTEGGRLLTGRNFDWRPSPAFDEDRIVFMVEPDTGIPYLSVAWAGAAGAVSGMNRAGISVTVNTARSSETGSCGTPVPIVVRQILQYAKNLDDAVAIAREARLMVPAIFLLGSRADQGFVTVERTPEGFAVLKPSADFMALTNHFTSDALKGDSGNSAYLLKGTTLARLCRMEELLKDRRDPLTPQSAAELLRDRFLEGGIFLGNGHPWAVGNLKASHAVIMDVTEGIVWVACPPRQLGRFVAFDVNDFDRELKTRTLAADPFLVAGAFNDFLASEKALKEAHKAFEDEEYLKALDWADAAARGNPGFYDIDRLRGEILLELGRPKEAKEAFKAALKERPAYQVLREAIEEHLEDL